MKKREIQMLRETAARYIWWEPPAQALKRPLRVLAQVMNIGDFEEVRSLLDGMGKESFKEAIAKAEPGWFSPRAWHYWHYRLGLAPAGGRVPRLPTRSF